MGVHLKLPFTVVNLRVHGWLTLALVEDHELIAAGFFIQQNGSLVE